MAQNGNLIQENGKRGFVGDFCIDFLKMAKKGPKMGKSLVKRVTPNLAFFMALKLIRKKGQI